MKLSYTRQAAADRVAESYYSIAELAEKCGVPYLSFRDAIAGRRHPEQGIRDHLPSILGIPLEELFDHASLSELPKARRRRSELVGAGR